VFFQKYFQEEFEDTKGVMKNILVN